MSTYRSTSDARRAWLVSKDTQKAIAKREEAKVKPEKAKAPTEKKADSVKP